jgi:hypothetical protein
MTTPTRTRRAPSQHADLLDCRPVWSPTGEGVAVIESARHPRLEFATTHRYWTATATDGEEFDRLTDALKVELFDRARHWLYEQGASDWTAQAFGHWVIDEVGALRHFTDLWADWNYGASGRRYRALHGARLSDAPPWRPGDQL